MCVLDGVFEKAAGHGMGADADHPPAPASVIFHPAIGIDADAVTTQAQATLRRRILRAFVGRGLLESFEAKEMLPSVASACDPVASSLTLTTLASAAAAVGRKASIQFSAA